MKKEKTISFIIHKINNHLASLNLSAEMLLRGISGDLNKEQKKYLNEILVDGKEIKNLLKEIKED